MTIDFASAGFSRLAGKWRPTFLLVGRIRGWHQPTEVV